MEIRRIIRRSVKRICLRSNFINYKFTVPNYVPAAALSETAFYPVLSHTWRYFSSSHGLLCLCLYCHNLCSASPLGHVLHGINLEADARALPHHLNFSVRFRDHPGNHFVLPRSWLLHQVIEDPVELLKFVVCVSDMYLYFGLQLR